MRNYAIIEDEKSQDLQLASWRHRRADGVSFSSSLRLQAEETQAFRLRD